MYAICERALLNRSAGFHSLNEAERTASHKGLPPGYTGAGRRLFGSRGAGACRPSRPERSRENDIAQLRPRLGETGPGEILADGQDILAKPGLARRQIAVVFEEASNIYSYMTVEENLLHSGFLNAVSGSYLREETDRLLREFGLYDKRHLLAHTLSRGMKQKLAVAAAFLKGAPMLFLDEPTLGLDVDAKAQMIDVLLQRRAACSILLTTHDMHLAHALGDRFYLIHRGRLVWSGTKDALRAFGIADGRELEEMMLAVAGGRCEFRQLGHSSQRH